MRHDLLLKDTIITDLCHIDSVLFFGVVQQAFCYVLKEDSGLKR